MVIHNLSSKDIGNLGEKVAAMYLMRHGFKILGKNISRKSGEIDIVASKEEVLHFIEVKSLVYLKFPGNRIDGYNPADNLHPNKIRKVVRTAEWIIAEMNWKGEWQVDGILVWLRKSDGMAKVSFLLQIL